MHGSFPGVKGGGTGSPLRRAKSALLSCRMPIAGKIADAVDSPQVKHRNDPVQLSLPWIPVALNEVRHE